MEPAPRIDAPPAFRGDVEGLRALAILLVIGCHARVPGFAGGFVGVDVFFVISGFLITRLLLAEWRGSGRIDFAAFYARRVRRLAPALLVMLAVTAAGCAILLAPIEQPDQARAIASAALWFSNLHFALADLDYFGASSASNTVLHTWSLGVEEQFYLLWPLWMLFLIGAFRWQRRRADADRLFRGLLVSLPLAMLLAAVIGMASTRLGFYMMPARFWQFVVGALVATAPLQHAARWPAVLCAGLGLVLLSVSAVLIDARTPYPGPWTLAPTAGAALLIAAASLDPGNAISRSLAHPAMQWVGRRSYGWYLWHWPVLVLGATLIATPGLAERLGLVAVALLIAAASYRWIESPFRHAGSRPRSSRAILGLGLVASIMAVLGVDAWSSRIPGWAADPGQSALQGARGDAPVIYAAGCDDWYTSDQVKPCIFGDRHAKHTAAVLGDSVALQWFEPLRQAFDRPGWRFVVITKSACPAADIEFVYERIGRRYDACTRWRRTALDYMATQLRPDVVVVGSAGSYAFDRAQWRAGSRSVLARLRAVTPHLYVLRATPLPGLDGPACLSRRAWRPRWITGLTGCSKAIGQAPLALEGITDAVRETAGVRLIDLNKRVCPAGQCSAEQAGSIVFRDGQHLTSSFAASLAAPMAHALAPSIAAVERQPSAQRR